MIYVYAITDVDCDFPPDVCGLDGRPAQSRALTNVAIVYGEVAGPRVEPSAENLWQHEAVVESVMRRCEAVLPVRFGMTFGDEVALEDTIARHGAVLATGLERVRGCVEMGVRVVSREAKEAEAISPNSAPADRSGRAYMLARLEDERRRRASQSRAEAIGDALDAGLSPLARDGTRRLLPGPQVLLTAAYLIPRDASESFTSRARSPAGEHPDVRIVCTGPWPPYHFAPALSSRAAEVAHG